LSPLGVFCIEQVDGSFRCFFDHVFERWVVEQALPAAADSSRSRVRRTLTGLFGDRRQLDFWLNDTQRAGGSVGSDNGLFLDRFLVAATCGLHMGRSARKFFFIIDDLAKLARQVHLRELVIS